VLVALTVVTIGAGVGLTLRGHASGDPSGAGALDALLTRSHNVIVFSEFGVDSDTIWAANPSDPSDRVELGAAPHAGGYSIFPALSPNGAYVAYTALGAGAADSTANSTGQLMLLDVQSGSTRVLASDIDLRSAPVWSPASDAVVVRQVDGTSDQLLRVDLSGTTQTIAAADAGLYAIDFSPDGGALYYASLSASGTDLMRAATSPGVAGPSTSSGQSAPQPVAHLSDGIARNWHLSPDGTQLAYLAQAPAGSATAFVAQVLDIESGSAQTPLGADAGAQFNPIWDNTDAITVGRVSGNERAALKVPAGGPSAGSGQAPSAGSGRAPSAGSGQAAAGSPLPSPAIGFDVPLSWSPDGAWLIARAFEGASPADPGPSHVVAIDASGARHQLSPQSDVEVAGWLAAP
jgi:hypothetical protein